MSERQIAEQFAKDFGKRYRYFVVTEEIVQQQRGKWSGPVQFRWEEDDDGKVQMILRTVER